MELSAPQLLLDARAFLGEGPAWDSARQRLYWVDIFPGLLHIFDPKSNLDEVIDLGQPLGCVAPAMGGNLILGLKSGLAILNLSPLLKGDGSGHRTEYVEVVRLVASPESGLPGNRFNDGKCGPDGRFLAGTMDNAEVDATGSLYSLSPGGPLQTLLTGVRISNGLAWSPDYKTLYFIDTPTHQVMAYDYDLRSGLIANPRVAVTVPVELGWPDGMTSDYEGRLWVALWGGAALTVWNPASGALVEKIAIPAKNVTSCVFGGPGQNELYVTTARKGLGEADLMAYPATGGLFRIQTNVTGLPTFVFGE
jgi:sugar lactone lactonase YvrE